MIYYSRLRSRSAFLCAGIVTLAVTLPAYAQLGQSELISPGGPDQATINASGGDWASGANPGPGWTPPAQAQYSPQFVRPGARFGGAPQQQSYQQAAPQQMMQQAAQQVTQQQMSDYGDQGAMGAGWGDTPRRQQQMQRMEPQQALGQSELITPSGAFQSAGGVSAPWEMQTAQEEMQQPQQMMPLPQQKAIAKAARPASSLNGQISQSAGMQPVTQFNPNSMMGSGNGMAAMMGAMGGGGMTANPMNAMMGGGRPAVNPMQAMMGGGAAVNPMGAMMGGGAAANPMGAMMGGMGGGGMGNLGALGAVGAAMMGGGGGAGMGGSPLDGIGRAISTAAQMGLVPAAKGSQPNIPMGAIDPNNLPAAALQGAAGQGGGNYMTPTGTFTQQPMQQQRVQQRRQKRPISQNGIVRNVERRAGQMGNMLMYNAAARGMSSMMMHW